MDALFDRKILFENLRTIDQAEISGVLKLYAGADEYHLYFQSGEVNFALASLLGGAHKIELNREQTLQLGSFTKGALSFNGAAEPERQQDWRLRAAELVLDAARKHNNSDRLSSEIGDLSQRLQPIFDLESRTRSLSLTEQEVFILSAIEPSMTIAELLSKAERPAAETLRSVYALISAGILDPPSQSADAAEVKFAAAMPASTPVPIPTASAPVKTSPVRHTGSLPKIQPAQAVPATEYAPPARATYAAPEPPPFMRQKIDTGKLQALAGVKIRSSAGGREQSQETVSEAEKCCQLGRALIKEGNIAAAEAYLRKAVSLSLENPFYLFQLGRLLAKMPKKQKEAEGLLLKACNIDAQAIEPRLALAELYDQLGMKVRAETVLNGILKIDPKHEGAKNRLRQIHGSSGSWKEEISGFFSKKMF